MITPALLAGFFLVSLLSPAAAAPEPARPAEDFVDSIGVATHWGYPDTPYGYAYDQVKALLGASGIRHVRNGFHPHLVDLNRTYGIQATVIYGPGTAPADAEAQLKASLPLVDMAEGPNEVDIFASSANYLGLKLPAGPIAYQNALWTATAGPHTVTTQVDDLNRMTESDETNNTRKQSFVVTGTAAP